MKVRQQQVGIAPTSLVSRPISLHSPSITTKITPSKVSRLPPFEKMLGSWFPELFHIHVFVGIYETIINNQEDLITLNLFLFSSL